MFSATQSFGRVVRGMAILLIAAGGLVICAPAKATAEDNCAWISPDTASGILGGPVTATVKHTNKNNDDTICEFVYQDGKSPSLIRVQVDTVEQPHNIFMSRATPCSNPSPLIAIGNEAVVCSIREKKHQTTELIVGRVRDRVFTISISTNANSPVKNELSDGGRVAAEQVSGILF